MKGYGQFCPVAKAAEILSERWTLLIIRELLSGSHRFNDIRRGIPLISTSLLTQRLKSLEEQGVVERRHAARGLAWEYHLTRAGEELAPMVEMAGRWGQRWVRSHLLEEDLDVGLLMWDMRRRIQVHALPWTPVCIHFRYPDVRPAHRDWWLLVEDTEVDLCPKDPGHEPDLDVVSDLRTMSAIWIGSLSLQAAVDRGRVTLYGPLRLRRSMHHWLGLSVFADEPQAVGNQRFNP
ncbi:winged helix-turn-helix transcriptional regulator [Arhodomonas sp. AD133]|uniref:winged helix-turn-helix transcriptional regulator n=1 Tax=Arhodomonas sp. AD133 TaxID=3415009 RepID=UPI003EBDDFC6